MCDNILYGDNNIISRRKHCNKPIRNACAEALNAYNMLNIYIYKRVAGNKGIRVIIIISVYTYIGIYI